MSSVRDTRQRAAARARLEREMAARQDAARRKRRLQSYIGAGTALAIVVGVVIWIVVAASDSEQPGTTTASDCYWAPQFPGVEPSALPSGIVDVGTPTTTPPRSGFQTLTFDTNLGTVKVEMDLAKTPCTAASLAHLANAGYYDNTTCHRLAQSIFALQCGDASGGQGGISYRFADENLPAGYPAYWEGDVAMANTGQPGTNGSQFFFLYNTSQLQGAYTLWGKVVEGLDIVKQVAAGGDDGAFEPSPGGGHPNTTFTFNSVTVSEVYPVSVAPSPAPSESPADSPSPAAS